MISQKKIGLVIIIVIVYLCLVSLPAMNLLRMPIPYLKETQYVKSLPKKNVLLERHFAQPQVQEGYRGEIVEVNVAAWTDDVIAKEIKESLAAQKPVFVSSAALSERMYCILVLFCITSRSRTQSLLSLRRQSHNLSFESIM